MKLPEENVGKKLYGLGLGNDVMNTIKKHKQQNQK